jgi:hypothetical protein
MPTPAAHGRRAGRERRASAVGRLDITSILVRWGFKGFFLPKQRNGSPAQQARLAVTREQRHRVYLRDSYRCVDCGTRDDLTVDHVVPLATTVQPEGTRALSTGGGA